MAHKEGKNLDWGKIKVIIDESDESNKKTLVDIVNGSTQLNTTQGERTEAMVEGGEIIGTRYQRNRYQLQFQEYGHPSIDSADGVVPGIHEVTVINCDEAEEFMIFKIKAVINVQPGYTSQYGTVTQYTCDAVRQTEGTIQWGEEQS